MAPNLRKFKDLGELRFLHTQGELAGLSLFTIAALFSSLLPFKNAAPTVHGILAENTIDRNFRQWHYDLLTDQTIGERE